MVEDSMPIWSIGHTLKSKRMKNTRVGFLVFAWVIAATTVGIPGSCQSTTDITGRADDPRQEMPPSRQDRARARVDSLRKAGVFVLWETLPSFPGGETALKRYLKEHVRYPPSARAAGRQGKVVVQFFIERDGTLDHIAAVGSHTDSALAAEAVRVVRGMPRWIPARKSGRIVKVLYALPVRFDLP